MDNNKKKSNSSLANHQFMQPYTPLKRPDVPYTKKKDCGCGKKKTKVDNDENTKNGNN